MNKGDKASEVSNLTNDSLWVTPKFLDEFLTKQIPERYAHVAFRHVCDENRTFTYPEINDFSGNQYDFDVDIVTINHTVPFSLLITLDGDYAFINQKENYTSLSTRIGIMNSSNNYQNIVVLNPNIKTSIGENLITSVSNTGWVIATISNIIQNSSNETKQISYEVTYTLPGTSNEIYTSVVNDPGVLEPKKTRIRMDTSSTGKWDSGSLKITVHINAFYILV